MFAIFADGGISKAGFETKELAIAFARLAGYDAFAVYDGDDYIVYQAYPLAVWE